MMRLGMGPGSEPWRRQPEPRPNEPYQVPPQNRHVPVPPFWTNAEPGQRSGYRAFDEFRDDMDVSKQKVTKEWLEESKRRLDLMTKRRRPF